MCDSINSANQSNELFSKYKDLTAKFLNKDRKLKYHNAPLSEGKYVSSLLRSILTSKHTALNSSVNIGNHNNYVRKNFWGFIRNVLERRSFVLPSFTRDHCTKLFIRTFSTVRPFKSLSILSWIPKFSEPSTLFDLSPPTYKKIALMILGIKSSHSLCPLNKLLIICFKRYPYLKSILTKVIFGEWESRQVPIE